MTNPQVKRVLVSVTDKTGVVEFARALHEEFGAEIISTGGTAKVIAEAGVDVTPIDAVTNFPEMMDGRVKTLHPMVHGGLLAKRDNAKHMAEAEEHGIKMIDMVVVNLYAFEKTVASGADFGTCIENIDIGGPSMLRSAAKNFESVAVVTEPSTYDAILEEMRANDGATTRETRAKLALKVFETTNAYDGAIAAWMDEQLNGKADFSEKTPDVIDLHLEKQQDLRYGENPHQSAAFYRLPNADAHSLVNAEQLNGKELSYNNILDTDACWTLAREFDEPAVVILKHQNPCGSATAATVAEAYDKAFACDPKSAFGGIIAANVEVSLEMIEHMNANKQFVEVIIAPSFEPAALELLQAKKNLRVLRTGGVDAPVRVEYRSVDGGILAQTADAVTETPDEFTVPTKRKPTDEEMDELLFAWKVCKGVKSNAILISKNHAGIGMGPGQPNRVDSGRLAGERALEACERMGLEPKNLVAASDAFFPFRDNIDALASFGVTAIIQPGGSIRDEESIEACDEHGIAMVFSGILPFSPRAWPQGQCAWASRQSAPPEPMLADIARGSDFLLCRGSSRATLNRRSRSAATRRSSFGPIRLAGLPLADLGCESGFCLVRGVNILPFSPRAWPQGQCAWASRQSAPPDPCSLTWAAKAALVEYDLVALDAKPILYGPGSIPRSICLPRWRFRLSNGVPKPAARSRGRFFAIMGQFSGEKI